MLKISNRVKTPVAHIAAKLLPKRLLFLDLETRGGLRDFGKIEMLMGGAIEYTRSTKYAVTAGKFEHWEIADIEALRERLLNFDGLIVGMNLYGYDYRVLMRYFDIAPLIPKTLDFQHSLWRIGKGSVSLGNLAKHNTRRRKVPGSDMAKIWDSGNKALVYKRNRVDCELTAQLYFNFLQTGRLQTNYGGFCLSDYDVENTLIVAGVMAQFDAHEYAWRIAHHNGVRGDVKFQGVPWTNHPAYDKDSPAFFFKALCEHGCGDNLVCTPTFAIKDLREWFATLRCSDCGRPYKLPQEAHKVRKGDPEYVDLADVHVNIEKSIRWRNPAKGMARTPQVFTIADTGGSFKIIDTYGSHWDHLPWDGVEKERYMLFEKDLQGYLKTIANPNRQRNSTQNWIRCHPDLDFWQSRSAP